MHLQSIAVAHLSKRRIHSEGCIPKFALTYVHTTQTPTIALSTKRPTADPKLWGLGSSFRQSSHTRLAHAGASWAVHHCRGRTRGTKRIDECETTRSRVCWEGTKTTVNIECQPCRGRHLAEHQVQTSAAACKQPILVINHHIYEVQRRLRRLLMRYKHSPRG